MNNNYELKLKDRKPEETITLIRNFFQNKNLDIDIISNFQSESGTWSCRLFLKYYDIAILSSNGKGINEIYSLASGHAELYERFCNKSIFLLNPFISSFITDTTNDTVIPEQIEKYFYNYLSNKDNVENYLDTILNKNFTLNYKNYFTENEYHIDPRIILYSNSTVGMCAGNSLEEAFNQGLSEILEFYCQKEIYENINNHYYRIDEKYINNSKLREIIDNIKNLNYNIYVYDLSYNYSMPVLMVILIDPVQKISSINLGSFPVFDIALERILTELYQGIYTFKKNNNTIQHPFSNSNNNKYRLNFLRTLSKISLFPESMLINYSLVKPSEIFLTNNKNYSNIGLNNYYKKLLSDLNLNIYYYNYSNNEDLYALHLYIPELMLRDFQYLPFKNLDVNIKTDCVNFIYHFYMMVNNIIKDDFKSSYKEFILLSELFNKIQNTDEEILSFIGNLMLNDFGYPYSKSEFSYNLLYTIIDFIYNKNIDIEINGDDIFIIYIKHYQFIQQYFMQYYSISDIKKILIEFGGIVNENDFSNINNKEYLFKEIYYNNIQNIIKSPQYKQLINIILN